MCIEIVTSDPVSRSLHCCIGCLELNRVSVLSSGLVCDSSGRVVLVVGEVVLVVGGVVLVVGGVVLVVGGVVLVVGEVVLMRRVSHEMREV